MRSCIDIDIIIFPFLAGKGLVVGSRQRIGIMRREMGIVLTLTCR